MKKVSEVFRKLRLALDRREVELKTEYSERIREHFTFMNKESIKLRYIFGELDKLYTNINKLQELLERFDDYTIVGSTQKIRLLDQSYLVLNNKLLNQHSTDSFKKATHPKILETMPLCALNPSACKKFIEDIGTVQKQYFAKDINQIQLETTNKEHDGPSKKQERHSKQGAVAFKSKDQEPIKDKHHLEERGATGSLIQGFSQQEVANQKRAQTVQRCQQLQTLY